MEFSTEMNETTTTLMENKGFAGMDAFAESYASLETSRGKLDASVTEMKGAFNLPEELSDENRAAINTAMGVPADFADYKVTYEGETKLDDGLIDSFKEFAKSKNIPADTFSDLVNFQIDAVASAMKVQGEADKKSDEEAVVAENEAIKKAEQGLMSELGDKYESTMTDAAEASKALGLFDLIDKVGKGSDPDWLKQLAIINGKLSEGTLKPGKEVTESGKEEELATLLESAAFKNAMDPGHKAAHARYNKLHGIG